MKKIEGHTNLYKKDSGVVVNTDYSSYIKAKERKQQKSKINTLEQRLDKIESLLERLLTENNK